MITKQEALLTDAMCGCHSEEADGLGWHYVMGMCSGPYSHERGWGDPLDNEPTDIPAVVRWVSLNDEFFNRVASLAASRRAHGKPLMDALDATHNARKRHPIEWPEDRS